MTATPVERPATELGPRSAGPARRAVIRWAWRLFRREWRQQLLVLALIILAVAATVVGSTVATNSPAQVQGTLGNAQDLATFNGHDARLSSQIASLEKRFGTVDVIENQTLSLPGSISTYDLRAQNPNGLFGKPLLSLVTGRYPSGPGEVAMTSQLASDFRLRIGDVWHEGATSRRLVGLVQNPQSLLDQFALVAPGQVSSPSQVNVLFNAPGVSATSIGPNVVDRQTASNNNAFNPETISMALVTIGMLLIALMAVGGFTVLAQRRLRSLGMLASIGATPRQVSLVVRANGVVVGAVGAVIGTVLGFLLWLAYRPHLEQSSHHLIGVFALPWLVLLLAVVLAIVATYVGAARPAQSMARVPIVAALSGRPAPPKRVHRSALPGVVFLVIAFLLLGFAGAASGAQPRTPELVLGLVALIPGVILLAPFCLSALARVGSGSPVAIRLALRDLARYRARAGSALAAISIGVLIAVIIIIVAAARYGNVLDYAGPNTASNQMVIYTSAYNSPPGAPGPTPGQLQSQAKSAREIASAVGAQNFIQLDTTNANLQNNAPGRGFNGALYVATPQLLRAYGISPSQIQPNADILTMRPGLPGVSSLSLTWCAVPEMVTPATDTPSGGPVPLGQHIFNSECAKPESVNHPVIQEVGALPSGTSAPNTVITERAVHSLGLQTSITGWLVQTGQPVTAAEIRGAQTAAAQSGMTVETKNDQPSSSEVIDWATVFGVALALAVLAMSVGLIRSETSGDLRTLTATGATNPTRRTLTATTAGALAFLGALLGTMAGYVGVMGYLRSNSLNGGIAALGNVPVSNLLIILVGMPLVAVVFGWLLGGRKPPHIAQGPLE